MTPKQAQPVITAPAGRGIVNAVQAFYEQYVTLGSPDYTFAAALWTLGTFLWPHFDAFPYLVITSMTKRSGKTRFGEVMSFVSSNPRSFAAMTPATLFRSIRDENPTLFLDEAETLSSETADTMRAVLNAGYRRGQTIPRVSKKGVEEWPAYCPKVFILIGDVFDTLRDRSIIVTMQRAEPKMRFVYDHARAEGQALRERAASVVEEYQGVIVEHYQRHAGLPFLTDRDEEIWLPLFAVCEVLAPDRLGELQRVSADLSTEKTSESRRYVNLLGAEKAAEDDEYARRLLRDLRTVMNADPVIFTAAALDRLKALPTGPWRKYRGEGLTAIDMGNLLSRFGLAPKVIRTGGRKRAKIARGYRRPDVEKALHTLKA